MHVRSFRLYQKSHFSLNDFSMTPWNKEGERESLRHQKYKKLKYFNENTLTKILGMID